MHEGVKEKGEQCTLSHTPGKVMMMVGGGCSEP